MNIFSAIGSFFASFFTEGERAHEEDAQAGAEGVAYDAELKRQYDAYYKVHGTADGFQYHDPATGKAE
jgi:hypothetical protein